MGYLRALGARNLYLAWWLLLRFDDLPSRPPDKELRGGDDDRRVGQVVGLCMFKLESPAAELGR
jgi:hypothetical protein